MSKNITPEDIRADICKKISDAEVTVRDADGMGRHYEVNVVSASFVGKSLLAQHKMVMDALKEKMASELHAVIIKTAAPKNS